MGGIKDLKAKLRELKIKLRICKEEINKFNKQQ